MRLSSAAIVAILAFVPSNFALPIDGNNGLVVRDSNYEANYLIARDPKGNKAPSPKPARSNRD